MQEAQIAGDKLSPAIQNESLHKTNKAIAANISALDFSQ